MIIKYIPLFILLFFLIKFLISYIEKSTTSLKDKIEDYKIENGIISIKDLQKNNYDRFIKTIQLYLEFTGFSNIENIEIVENYNNKLTIFKAILNKENIYIACSQNDLLDVEAKDEDNWTLTGRPDIQYLLSEIISKDCRKGIFITNSSFSTPAIEFTNEINDKNPDIEIKLIDGYELTKVIRAYKNYCLKEDLLNEL